MLPLKGVNLQLGLYFFIRLDTAYSYSLRLFAIYFTDLPESNSDSINSF